MQQITELEKLSPLKCAKEFMIIRRRARNNIFTIQRKKNKSEKDIELMNEWIKRHDIISEKLNEPLWK